MSGIKESKEMLVFVLEFAKAVGVSAQDGKFSLLEISNFLGSLMKASSAVEGASAIPAELADLDEAEKAELMAIVDELHLPQEKVELAAKLLLKAAVQLAEFAKLWKA